MLWFSYSFSHAYYCIIRWDKGMIHMSLGRQNVLMPCYAHWISETLSLISVFLKAHLKIRPCVIMPSRWGGGGEGILFCCTYSRHAVKSLIWRFCTDVGKAAAKRLWEALVGKCATQFLAETNAPTDATLTKEAFMPRRVYFNLLHELPAVETSTRLIYCQINLIWSSRSSVYLCTLTIIA